MTFSSFILAFLPELILLFGALGLFVIALGDRCGAVARTAAIAIAVAAVAASVLGWGSEAVLFDGAYRVDPFSQILKLILSVGLLLVLLADGGLPDIRADVHGEYYLLLTLSAAGLVMLVSCVDLITLVVALELSSFPLYLMVPMRREKEGHRVQMESAIKYIMFGVAANGVMFFGMSYLFGISGSTSLSRILAAVAQHPGSPLVIVGLALTFCGVFYKLAVFPFHFWTPDVYQGASNETASMIASLPKVGAVAVLVRFTGLAGADGVVVAQLLALLAAASMFYGNLVALVQTDLKRLLGFSGIAHAGYALLGFVALDAAGYGAALFYITGYLVMVLACFVVICRVSQDGANVPMADLAGLHQRSPLLAVTLLVGVFGLAGIPPFAGFAGKLALLTAAYAKGYTALVVLAVINTAIAIYYYLSVVREAFFRDAGDRPAIRLNPGSRVVSVGLILAIAALGIFPGPVFAALSRALATFKTL